MSLVYCEGDSVDSSSTSSSPSIGFHSAWLEHQQLSSPSPPPLLVPPASHRAFSPSCHSDMGPQRRGRGTRTRPQSPDHQARLRKLRRLKANDRERCRMHMLNDALERLRAVLPLLPEETRLTKIETLRFANGYIEALSRVLTCGGDAEAEMCSNDGSILLYVGDAQVKIGADGPAVALQTSSPESGDATQMKRNFLVAENSSNGDVSSSWSVPETVDNVSYNTSVYCSYSSAFFSQPPPSMSSLPMCPVSVSNFPANGTYQRPAPGGKLDGVGHDFSCQL